MPYNTYPASLLPSKCHLLSLFAIVALEKAPKLIFATVSLSRTVVLSL